MTILHSDEVPRKQEHPNGHWGNSRAAPDHESSTMPNTDDAEHYLEVLIGPDWQSAVLVFQTYDDDAARKAEGERAARAAGREFHDPFAQILIGTWAQCKARLMRFNLKRASVCLTVNATIGGRQKEQFRRVRAVWCERDKDEPLPDWPLAPHIVVESSPGHFHLYWLVDDMTPDDHTRFMACMVGKWGSDPAARDLVRVLRVPGFWHQKGRPWRVRLVTAESRDALPPYSSSVLMDAFGVQDWEAEHPDKPPEDEPPRARSYNPISDTVLLRLAASATNGEKFTRLWEGDETLWTVEPRVYESQSEADCALCSLLAFYCGDDPARIDRLFRLSKLYRVKWNREDYSTNTITEALRGRRDFYAGVIPAEEEDDAASWPFGDDPPPEPEVAPEDDPPAPPGGVPPGKNKTEEDPPGAKTFYGDGRDEPPKGDDRKNDPPKDDNPQKEHTDKGPKPEGENFAVDPKASPPADLMLELLKSDKQFRQTWDHKRKDFKTHTLEAYEYSLAYQARHAGWTVQQIVNLLIYHRREYGGAEANKSRYQKVLQRTSGDAEPRDEDTIRDAEAEELRKQGPAAIRAKLAELLKVPVQSLIKRGSDGAVFSLLLESGKEIAIGKSAQLLTPRHVRAQIAETSHQLVPAFTEKQWGKVFDLLMSIVEVRHSESTRAAKVKEWVAHYIAEYDNISKEKAVPQCDPFRENGRVYVHVMKLRNYLNTNLQIRIEDTDLWVHLDEAKFTSKKESVRIKGTTGAHTKEKVCNRSYWSIEESALDMDTEIPDDDM